MTFLSNSVCAQTKTDSIKVWGNCMMCKQRIEQAAAAHGVASVLWNVKSKSLTISYNPKKIKLDDIQKNISAAGHDTQKFVANETAYNNLPECCRFERTGLKKATIQSTVKQKD